MVKWYMGRYVKGNRWQDRYMTDRWIKNGRSIGDREIDDRLIDNQWYKNRYNTWVIDL